MQTGKSCQCGSTSLYKGLRCRPCYNEREWLFQQARRSRPGAREHENARARERDRKRYAEDPEFRFRKQQAANTRRLFYAQGSLAEAEWTVLNHVYGRLCASCLSPAEVMDHVDPLAGGSPHTAANVVPACSACNLSKGDQLLIEWGGR